MIAKNVIGRSFKGVCNYLLSKVEKGKGEILEVRNVRETKGEMIADFNMSRHYNPRLTKCVWHTSLSFDNSDDLNDEKMVAIAKDWMHGMDFLETQWAIIKHTDTGHPHVHIVMNRIGDDGLTISDSNNYKRSEATCRELEKKYALTQLPEVRQEEKINKEKLRGLDSFKSECHLAIQESLRRAKSFDDFNSLMKKEKNIECIWKFNPDGSPRGLVFVRDGQKIKSSDINRLYSARGITNYIDHKNQRLIVTQEREARKALTNAAYSVKSAVYETSRSQPSPEDDIIAIDRVLGVRQRGMRI